MRGCTASRCGTGARALATLALLGSACATIADEFEFQVLEVTPPYVLGPGLGESDHPGLPAYLPTAGGGRIQVAIPNRRIQPLFWGMPPVVPVSCARKPWTPALLTLELTLRGPVDIDLEGISVQLDDGRVLALGSAFRIEIEPKRVTYPPIDFAEQAARLAEQGNRLRVPAPEWVSVEIVFDVDPGRTRSATVLLAGTLSGVPEPVPPLTFERVVERTDRIAF